MFVLGGDVFLRERCNMLLSLRLSKQTQVRERYPTFNDAIRDLDDALSMVSLFDSLPTDQKNEIRADVIQESAKLIHEFFLYVVQTRSLQKCFASIKGYYFQASIGGETVTWLVPHKFAQELPAEVDFKVHMHLRVLAYSVQEHISSG